jgi:hypothetical protein
MELFMEENKIFVPMFKVNFLGLGLLSLLFFLKARIYNTMYLEPM